MNKAILLEGIPPNLNLGVNFLSKAEIDSKENPSDETIVIITLYQEENVPLGVMDFNLENIAKFRDFRYIFLEKNKEGKLVPSNNLLTLIPREFEDNELIGGFEVNEKEIDF